MLRVHLRSFVQNERTQGGWASLAWPDRFFPVEGRFTATSDLNRLGEGVSSGHWPSISHNINIILITNTHIIAILILLIIIRLDLDLEVRDIRSYTY